jgi:hypothetical protein
MMAPADAATTKEMMAPADASTQADANADLSGGDLVGSGADLAGSDLAAGDGSGAGPDGASSDSGGAGDGGDADGGITSINVYTALIPNNTPQVATITIDHGAHTFQVVDPSYTIVGTATALPNGFLKLTVTAGCDGTNCTPTNAGSMTVPNGATVHAVEAVGYFLVAVPDGGANGVAGVAQNSCPLGMFATYNFVLAGLPGSYDFTTGPAYGVSQVSGTAAAVMLSGTYYRIDDSNPMAVTGPPAAACNNGMTSLGPGNTLMTSGNGFLVQQNGGGAAALGFAQQGNLTLADIENRTYSGFVFSNSGGNGSGVSLAFGNGPTGNGAQYTDIDNNVLGGNGTFTLTAVVNGLVSGTFSTGAASGGFRAVAFKDGAQTYLAMIVADSSGGSGNYNMVLVSR